MSKRRLFVGDLAPEFILPSHQGTMVTSEYLCGKPLVIVFYGTDQRHEAIAQICSFRDLYSQFQNLGANVISISMDSVEFRCEFAKKYKLPFFLLSDVNYEISTAFNVCEKITSNGQNGLIFYRKIFLLDANRKITKIYDQVDPHTDVLQVIEDLKKLVAKKTSHQIFMQAPVLLISDVFDAEFCQKLIHIWKTKGNFDSGFPQQPDGENTRAYQPNYSHKIRQDHILQGEDLQEVLDLISTRIFPEIWKAFNYQVNRCNESRVICYDSDRGGYFRPHRDNTNPDQAHRKFALTINLNVGEYEGAYLKFPEYGLDLYQPETGGAVIFSCSLLHEVTDITAGKRFAIRAFID